MQFKRVLHANIIYYMIIVFHLVFFGLILIQCAQNFYSTRFLLCYTICIIYVNRTCQNKNCKLVDFNMNRHYTINFFTQVYCFIFIENVLFTVFDSISHFLGTKIISFKKDFKKRVELEN